MSADRLHGEAVGQRDVVTDLIQFCRRQFETRGINAPSITEVHESSGLVEREDILDAIAYPLRDVTRVIRERPGRFAGLPSAEPVLERLRQIPVIQRRKRFDAVGQKFVQKAVVEVEAFGVRGAGSFRKHPRPRDRKTIGFDAQLLDQADVFLVPMIVIVGAVGVAVIADLARGVGEGVPDRAASAIFVDSAFDLIRGSGRTPQKAVRETARGVPVGYLFCFDVLRPRRRRRHSERGKTRKLGKMPTRELVEHQHLLSGSRSRAGAFRAIAVTSRYQIDRRKSCRSRIQP